MKKRLATRDYNKVLKQFQTVSDEIANVQREKDLKVDRINKKYEAKIQELINIQDELKLVIRDSKEYFKTH